MKKVLLTTGVAVLALATIVSAATFSTNLTVGSTGADVVALQTALMNAGYNIPAIASGAAAKGYFGSQTQAAVKLFQTANGVINTGFVGPLTRGVLNGGSAVVVAPFACPVGYTCTANPGTTPVVANPGYISTTGSEGLITTKLAANPIADANIRISRNVPVYGIEVKAQGSDMKVDRVLLQMAVGVGGAATSLSNPATFVTGLHAYDGSSLIKSWNLGAADFNKDSSDRYYVIASGMNFVVSKDTTKVITFVVDTIGVSSDQSSRYLTVQGYAGNTQNVRAIDGAGQNSYTDMSGSSNSRVQVFTTSGASSLVVTLDTGATPKSTTNRLSTTDGIKGLTMQSFSVKSETGPSILKTIQIGNYATSTTGLPSVVYLYDGSTMLASASGAATVSFTDLNINVPKDTTKTLVIKADFPSTAGGQAASTSVLVNGIKWEKPDSTTASTSPSSALVSNDQYLYSAGVQWTLVSASSVATVGVKDVASSSVTGTIVLKGTAFGGSMTKPVLTNFSLRFASSTATSYTAANAVTGGNGTIAVSPSDATVGDGGVYNVTLSDTIYSSDSELASNQPLFMVIKDIDSTVGGNTVTDQTWGIDTFYTPAQQLTRSTY